jgi:hypothetical protein
VVLSVVRRLKALGDERGGSTRRLGEEGGGGFTTQALAEEGGDKKPTPKK